VTTHQPKKKTLTYYAIRWFYPRGTIASWDQDGTYACCQPVRFGSQAARDVWLRAGPAQCEIGYREAVTLTSLPYGWGRREFVSDAAAWARCGYTDYAF